MTAGEDYILYAFLAFISLLQVTILGVLYRQSRDIGELKGKFDGLSTRMDRSESHIDQRLDRSESHIDQRLDRSESHIDQRLDRSESRIDQRMDQFEARMNRFEQQLAALSEQVAEIRGMMLSLHERMDLLMRHRHDDVGRVVITPEEVAAD